MSRRAPRRLFVVAAAAIALALLPVPGARADELEGLFVIERSKNANVIHYDAQIAKNGSLSASEPVVAYWIMKAVDGHKEALTLLEWKMAYGFDVTPSGGGWDMRLSAYGQRPIRLVKVGGRWRAQVTIAGKAAYLNKIFIQTKEGGVLPQVLYAEFFGDDVASGKPLHERVDK